MKDINLKDLSKHLNKNAYVVVWGIGEGPFYVGKVKHLKKWFLSEDWKKKSWTEKGAEILGVDTENYNNYNVDNFGKKLDTKRPFIDIHLYRIDK